MSACNAESGYRCPRTEAACSACRSCGAKASMRARTMLWIEPGMAPSDSPAVRNSWSRNSGLPSARSIQDIANAEFGSWVAPAKATASAGRSGPRSIVMSGAPRAAPRQLASIGSPSTREVMHSSAWHCAVVSASCARCRRTIGLAQCTSSTMTRQGRCPAERRTSSQKVAALPRLRVSLSIAS